MAHGHANTTFLVPLQYFGIGDIIFSQTAVRDYADGRKILWPAMPHFVEGLNRAYPDITFIDYNLLNINYENRDRIVRDNMEIIPLRFSDSICKVPYHHCMKSKYWFFGKKWEQWKEKAMWQRDTARESLLYRDVIGDNDTPYRLINDYFGSEKNKMRTNINLTPKEGIRDIHMSHLEGFSLFDWAMLLQNATEIHTVSTSIIYILELLDLKAKNIDIYIRKPVESSHANYEYILQRHNYILHE
jgi:hypothetical protein